MASEKISPISDEWPVEKASEESVTPIRTLDELNEVLKNRKFPSNNDLDNIPFGKILTSIEEKENSREQKRDFRRHMDLILDGIEDLMSPQPSKILFDFQQIAGANAGMVFQAGILNIKGLVDPFLEKLLRIAVLLHDIGLDIRRDRHPYEGWHVLEELYPKEKEKLVEIITEDYFSSAKGDVNKRQKLGKLINREFRSLDELSEDEKNKLKKLIGKEYYSLLTKIIRYHELFGVVSTGESSILVFTTLMPYYDLDDTSEYLKIIAMLFMINLADINARIEEREDGKNGLKCELGTTIVEDWIRIRNAVIAAKGNRSKFYDLLIESERDSGIAIQRIRRLLQETAKPNQRNQFTNVVVNNALGTVLRGRVGEFCDAFAHFYRLDYLLRFLREYQNSAEANNLTADQIAINVVEILEAVVMDYRGSVDDGLIGVEFIALGGNISKNIIKQLQSDRQIALQWILDEISIFR